jgi:hypothetical protein
MNTISLAVADDFSVDAYFDIEEGSITTEKHDAQIYHVHIRAITMEFNSGTIADITNSIPKHDMSKIEQQILDYHLYGK